MSHSEFAQIWYELERRADLDYLLQEAFGKIMLCHSSKRHSALISLGIRAKFIFDLQRYSLLTSLTETQQSLTFDQLADAVKQIAQLAKSYFTSESVDQTFGRRLYRQAFTSGIRVLLLRANAPYCDPTNAVALLEELYYLWPFWDQVDNHVLRPFIFASIQEFTRNTNIADDFEELQIRQTRFCTHTEFLPSKTFPSDVYALQLQRKRPESTALRISTCLPHCVGKHQRFWEWMDFELVFLVSSYQLMGCPLQTTGERNCHHLGHDDRETNTDGLRQLADFLLPFYSILNSKLSEYQLWVRQLQYLPHCVDDHDGQCFTLLDDRVEMSALSDYLLDLAQQLRDRAQAMTISTKAVDSVFEGTRKYIASMYSDPEAIDIREIDHSNDFNLFALSCPQAHIIHYHHLYRLLYNLETDTFAGLKNLQNHEDEFEIKTSCPFCGAGKSGDKKLRVRKILALSSLPGRARAIPYVRQPTVEPPPPPMTPPPPPPSQSEARTVTSPQLLSVETNVASPPSSEKTAWTKRNSSPTSRQSGGRDSVSSFSKKLQSIFSTPRSSIASPTTPQIPLRIALSSDASAFVAHTSQLAGVYSFSSKAWSNQSIYRPALTQAAVGPRYLALVDRECNLELFENVSGAPVKLDSRLQTTDTPIRAMCFSRSGTLLASSTEKAVTIINLGDLTCIRGDSVSIWTSKFPKGPNSHFDSQVMAFTPDATHLCLSTRYISDSEHSGELLTIVIKVTGGKPEKLFSRRSIIAHYTIDHGLTAIACQADEQTISYLVCSSNNAGDTPYVLTWSKGRPAPVKFELYHKRDKLDTKLQNAVPLDTRGGRFVAVFDDGQIFLVDNSNKSVQSLSRRNAVYAPGAKGEYVANLQIASVNATNVRAVWWDETIKVYNMTIEGSAQPALDTIDSSPFNVL